MNMLELIEKFPAQLEEALRIGREAKLKDATHPIQNVFISGLGGSGIGGTIVSELAFNVCPVPVNVGKGYFIPEYIHENSLVIISSYSGNTEETLACLEQAIARKAQVVCITSGGRAEEIAKKNNLGCILIPGGMPPRSCLGYSLTQLFFVFVKYNLMPSSVINDIEKSVTLLKKEQAVIRAESEKLAAMLHGRTPVIYSTTGNEGIAIRFRQQLNENAKVLCWHHVIPEMNHNELVGWAGGDDKIAVVLFRDAGEYERNNFRIDINKKIIKEHTSNFAEIFSKGASRIEKSMYLIHFGDWVSFYLAGLRGVDAVEVNVINFLKTELSKK